jgi:phage FluMu protein Com
MPIEFRCSQCGKLLRTGDNTAGKQAKCPSCGSIQPIPMASQGAAPAPVAFPPLPSGMPPSGVRDNPFAAQPAPPGSPFGNSPPAVETMNPYQSPTGPSAFFVPPGSGAFQPTRIDASDIIDRTWRIFKANWLMCTAGTFLTGIINGVAGYVIGIVVTMSPIGRGINPNDPLSALPSQFTANFVALFFTTWLEAGLAMFMLRVARGEEPDLADLFKGGRFYLALLPARLLFIVVFFLGYMACIVPGIILALMFWQYSYLIIDRRVGALESFGLARQLSDGNKGTLFLLHLAAIAFMIIGLLCLCVGAIVAAGYVNLMWAVTYLVNSGQRTGDQQMYQAPLQR